MFEHVSWILLLNWCYFFIFLNVHIQHSNSFNGSSRKYEVALMLSSLLGSIVLFVLLYFLFQKAHWYTPIVLFTVGGLISGLAQAFIIKFFNPMTVSLIAFFNWPIGAYFVYSIVT